MGENFANGRAILEDLLSVGRLMGNGAVTTTGCAMSATTYDAWVLSRVMGGVAVEDEAAGVSSRFKGLVEGLKQAGPEERMLMLYGFSRSLDDPTGLLQAIADTDPYKPPPETEAPGTARGATLADIRRIMDDQPWPWPGWLAGGALTVLAADAGIGKTLLALTLARCLWTGAPWPDGQKNPYAPQTRTLWVPGDHHYHQLMQVAHAYGIPDEAVLINRPAAEPIGDVDLDEDAAVAALARRIEEDRPGLVILDTVGQVTIRNLGRSEESRLFFNPLMQIAARCKTSFLLLTHLSKEGDPLGRRIIAAGRAVWKLSQPDPEGQPDRRKLWVAKSYAMKPAAMGMTITAEGCSFDATPPEEPAPDKGGRPVTRMPACKAWLRERLTAIPAMVKDLRTEAEGAGFSTGLLYKASETLGVEEYVLDRRKWWKLPTEP